MKKLVWLVIVVVVLAAVYYFTTGNRSGTVSVTLDQQNASGETGTVVLNELNGKVEVSMMISGQPPGVAQPAHIHKGYCPNPGEVLFPLTSPKDGSASITSLGVTMAELKAQGPLAVNIHKSSSETLIYVACGNIVF